MKTNINKDPKKAFEELAKLASSSQQVKKPNFDKEKYEDLETSLKDSPFGEIFGNMFK